MGINIYTIRHPLVLNWVNYLTHNKIHNNDRHELINKINLTLIYEACRKIIQGNALYIKYIDQINEVWLTDNSRIDLFSSNINILQMIGKDIRDMIPNLNIHLVSWQNHSDSKSQPISTNGANILTRTNTNIIILEEELESDNIVSTLKQIQSRQHKTQKIQICCCYCNTKELDNLSQEYSELDIYTGQITDK
uniref:Uracil phosphoribosyltransferase n=1 Tax=Izziella formosana TaxID=1653389 RepID=A0A1G4NVF8_9FLOR|nr:Uracil phosphoribosyltransferase [Izziella formosana]SCW22469.1 Uracil phosphoribosyltransferase [Izziella formosana]